MQLENTNSSKKFDSRLKSYILFENVQLNNDLFDKFSCVNRFNQIAQSNRSVPVKSVAV